MKAETSASCPPIVLIKPTIIARSAAKATKIADSGVSTICYQFDSLACAYQYSEFDHFAI